MPCADFGKARNHLFFDLLADLVGLLPGVLVSSDGQVFSRPLHQSVSLRQCVHFMPFLYLVVADIPQVEDRWQVAPTYLPRGRGGIVGRQPQGLSGWRLWPTVVR